MRLPAKLRTKAERNEAWNILYGGPSGVVSIYDPETHPQGLIDYFTEALEEMGEVERVETKHGDVKHVQKPVTLPTVSRYAATIGLSCDTLREWSEKHTEFGEAMARARSIQEAILVEMGTKGAYNPQVVALILKNIHGWSDRLDQRLLGRVSFVIDEQDSQA